MPWTQVPRTSSRNSSHCRTARARTFGRPLVGQRRISFIQRSLFLSPTRLKYFSTCTSVQGISHVERCTAYERFPTTSSNKNGHRTPSPPRASPTSWLTVSGLLSCLPAYHSCSRTLSTCLTPSDLKYEPNAKNIGERKSGHAEKGL